MALSRPINVQFWNDEKVSERFTLNDKIVFLYLLTNEHLEQLGIYKITYKVIANEICMPIELVKESIRRLDKELGVIKYSDSTNEVAILNYLKHSIMNGGATSKCYDNIERKVSDKDLLLEVYKKLLLVTDNRPTFTIALTKIREALPFSEEYLNRLVDRKRPAKEYYYDDNDNIIMYVGPTYDEWDSIDERNSRTRDINNFKSVLCIDGHYRFVECIRKPINENHQEFNNESHSDDLDYDGMPY
jgi:hypothetical protein